MVSTKSSVGFCKSRRLPKQQIEDQLEAAELIVWSQIEAIVLVFDNCEEVGCNGLSTWAFLGCKKSSTEARLGCKEPRKCRNFGCYKPSWRRIFGCYKPSWWRTIDCYRLIWRILGLYQPLWAESLLCSDDGKIYDVIFLYPRWSQGVHESENGSR